MTARMLGRVDGERRLTDLRHVGQALHAAALEEGLGLSALTDWLRRRRADTRAEITTDRVRRLDTDAAATQVVTLHASKGLQYPVVYLPFAFDRHVRTPDTLLLHDHGRRVLDIGGPGTRGRPEREAQSLAEEAGEALRHLYVGLTRAQSQVVTWWAPTFNTPGSGLHRVLFGHRDIDRRRAGPGAAWLPTTSPRGTCGTLEQRAGAGRREGGCVGERAARRHRPSPTPALRSASSRPNRGHRVAAGLVLVAGRGGLRRRAMRPLPAGRRGRSAGDRRSRQRAGDRRSDATRPSRLTATATGGRRSAAARCVADVRPSGRDHVRHAGARGAGDHRPAGRRTCPAELRDAVVRADSPVGPPRSPPNELGTALLPVLQTPLGPLAGGFALRDISTRDRLPEMDFELPLAGGDGAG